MVPILLNLHQDSKSLELEEIPEMQKLSCFKKISSTDKGEIKLGGNRTQAFHSKILLHGLAGACPLTPLSQS